MQKGCSEKRLVWRSWGGGRWKALRCLEAQEAQSFHLIRDGLGDSDWGTQRDGQGVNLLHVRVERPHVWGAQRRLLQKLVGFTVSSVPSQEGSLEARGTVAQWTLTSPSSLVLDWTFERAHPGEVLAMRSLWMAPCMNTALYWRREHRERRVLRISIFLLRKLRSTEVQHLLDFALIFNGIRFWSQHLKMPLILALHLKCEVFGPYAVWTPKRNKHHNAFKGEKVTYVYKGSIWKWPLKGAAFPLILLVFSFFY